MSSNLKRMQIAQNLNYVVLSCGQIPCAELIKSNVASLKQILFTKLRRNVHFSVTIIINKSELLFYYSNFSLFIVQANFVSMFHGDVQDYESLVRTVECVLGEA